MSSRKRARVSSGGYRTKRPIDKEITVVNLTSLTAQQSLDILPGGSINRAATVTGVRWSLGVTEATSVAVVYWAVVHVPEGATVSTMSTTSAAKFYTPERNVIAHGVITASTGTSNFSDGSTKAMRKLQSGDALKFIAVSANVAITVDRIAGTVQYFLKE